MSQDLLHEDLNTKKSLPITPVIASGLIAFANWQGNSKVVSTLTDVRPDSSWVEWLYRWPGSFFKASPYMGKVGDTALSVGLIAATMAHTERDEGIKRTLKIAAFGHALGCAATRTAAVVGLVPSEQMHALDVGSSSATAALVGNWVTRFFRGRDERFSTRQARAIAMGIGAIGIAALGVLDPSVTDTVGHVVPYAYGMWEGGRKPLPTQQPLVTAEAFT